MLGVARSVVRSRLVTAVLGARGDRVGRRERLRAGLVDAAAGDRRGRGRRDAGLAVLLHRRGGGVVGQRRAEHRLGVGERHAVLRALRAGQRRHDRGQVELEPLGVPRLGRRVVPHALGPGVGLHELHLLLGAAGQAQVGQRLVVDREDRAGRAVLGAHVADGGPVGQRDVGDARAVELDELADDAVLAQLLGDRQHEVGGGGAGRQLTGELEAHHLRDEHGDRLPEHGGLGLDAADAPAQDAQAVDHRGVRVGADEGVGVGLQGPLDGPGEHDRGQPLEVDLVHDPGLGRHDLEVVEGGLAPLQELVALAVALVLQRPVELERLAAAEEVGDDGVVDDQLGRRQRVDLLGIATEVGHRLAHGGQVDDARHPGEVLHEHAGRRVLDLGVGLALGLPLRHRADGVGRGVLAVLGAQEVLQEHLQAVRQVGGAVHRVEPEHLVGRPGDVERALGAEAVLAGHAVSSSRRRSALVISSR